jgi:hypothetical protein
LQGISLLHSIFTIVAKIAWNFAGFIRLRAMSSKVLAQSFPPQITSFLARVQDLLALQPAEKVSKYWQQLNSAGLAS